MKTYDMETQYEPCTGQHEGIAAIESDDGEWVPAEVAQRLYDTLERITKSGSWYITALEIDVHEDGAMDGEELERLALAALADADGEGYDPAPPHQHPHARQLPVRPA